MGGRFDKRQAAPRSVMISKSDDYFAKGCGRCERFATPDCSTRQWKRGLGELRRICLEAELVETVKWGHPCYLHGGRNIAILGAFRDDFRISFFNAAVMKDPEEVLEKQGPNTQHANMIRFADNDRVLDLEPVIRSYLMEAAAYADAGIRAPKENVDLDMPDELVETLDADVELAEAFRKLTPGRKRSYVIDLNSAKKPETRLARIAKFRDKILAGKGALER